MREGGGGERKAEGKRFMTGLDYADTCRNLQRTFIDRSQKRNGEVFSLIVWACSLLSKLFTADSDCIYREK